MFETFIEYNLNLNCILKSNITINCNSEANWIAIYTRPKYEKKVHAELLQKGFSSYLPLQKVLRQWSDRKKWVELPLFFNYVFVQIQEKDYFNVLNTNGVVSFVSFENKVAVIPNAQINTIKKFLCGSSNIETLEALPDVGDEVEIVAGPLMGIKGSLISIKGRKRVGVNIEYLNKALLVEVATSYIKCCN